MNSQVTLGDSDLAETVEYGIVSRDGRQPLMITAIISPASKTLRSRPTSAKRPVKKTATKKTAGPVRKSASKAETVTPEEIKKSNQVATRIIAARKLQGVSMRELSRRADMSHSRLQRIEKDSEKPILFIDLVRISEALEVPVTRLLNGSPVRDRVLAAARAGTLAGADGVIDSVIDILEIEDQLNEISLPNQQIRTYPIILRGTKSPKEWGKIAAQEIRALWEITSGPLIDLAQLIERKTGIYVAIEQMLDGVDGVSLSDPLHGTALIAAGTTKFWERQRFTLAHELGHIVAGQMKIESFADGSRSDDEKAADEFARNLLLPWPDIAKLNFERQGNPWLARDVAALAWKYQVSPKVAAIQLSRAGFIAECLVGDVASIPAENWSLIGGWEQERQSVIAGAKTPRKPSGMMNRIVHGWLAGIVPLGMLTRLTSRPEEEWNTLLASLEMQPVKR